MIYRETLTVGGAENTFELTIVSTDNGVVEISRGGCDEENPNDITREAVRQLKEYFYECRRSFDFPFDLNSCKEATPFRLRVWEALMRVPYGRTVTYGELASVIGDKNAARAVGGAVGANPMLILVPCHRVVASVGIGGFSAGVDLKRYLLDVEGVVL